MNAEEVNNSALSSDDDKRLQPFDKIETYEQMCLKCAKAKWWWWEICFVKKYVDCPIYGKIVLKQ